MQEPMNAKERYCFRKIHPEEVSVMFELVKQRIHWMDEVGIQGWNMADYTAIYPLSYYESMQDNIFVLADRETEEIVCAGVLLETDSRWKDESPACYLHNFVSRVNRATAEEPTGQEICKQETCKQETRKQEMPGRTAGHMQAPPVGRIFLTEAEEYARKLGKNYMRLDSAAGNDRLAAYYERQGYLPQGTCVEGGYHGILRQKPLKNLED